MRFKRIKISLNNGSCICEHGTLHYTSGDISVDANMGGLGGIIKKKIQNELTTTPTIRPKFVGSGEICLDPTWDYFSIIYLKNESVVVDKGLFYACEGSISLSVNVLKNVGAGLLGGEGFFQTKLSGTGWVVIATPVPPEEIQKFVIKDDKVVVDGNFAVLRKGDVDFQVRKSTNTFVGSIATGEKLLQTFTGTGEVWVCPTLQLYYGVEGIHHRII